MTTTPDTLAKLAAKAAHEAVSAIYFADSSDYLPALRSITRLLAPDLAAMLDTDEQLAWQTSDDRANGPDEIAAQALPAAEPVNLWCIHIPGPDELYAAPSVEAAVHMKQRHNAAMAEHFKRNPDPEGMGPLRESCFAEVRAWSWSAQAHAVALMVFDAKAWGWPAPQAAQQAAQDPCGKCDECGKGQPEGWALYCVSCLEKTGLLAKEALPNAQHVSSTAADLTGPNDTAAQAPAGWMPIETAPKDGTEIAAIGDNGGNPINGQHRVIVKFEFGRWVSEPNDESVETECMYLTGWTPLPPAALPQPPQPQSAQPQEDAA